MKITKDELRNIFGTHKNFQTGEIKIEPVLKEIKNGGLSTFSYIHGGVDFTDKRLRLARGLTLDEENKIVTVGFEKFFVENQLETKPDFPEEFKEEYSRLQKEDVYTCYEKLDGTMIILSVYNNEFICSTTSSSNNTYTQNALLYFNNLTNKDEIFSYLKENDKCFIFEWISYKNRIAVEYDVDDYILLAESNKNTLATKAYALMDNTFGFKGPKVSFLTYDELQDVKRKAQEIEGFVVYNKFGNAIKIKTDWWFDNHFKNTIFLNHFTISKADIKFVVDSILNDDLDDLYALQNSDEKWEEFNKVGKIADEYFNIINFVYGEVEKYKTTREIVEAKPKYQSLVATVFKKHSIDGIAFDKLLKFIRENLKEKYFDKVL